MCCLRGKYTLEFYLSHAFYSYKVEDALVNLADVEFSYTSFSLILSGREHKYIRVSKTIF